MIRFIKEYREWVKDHRQEVQEAKLRKEAMKAPLNYQLLDQLFLAFSGKNKDMVMVVEGKDFTVKLYYDDRGTYQRKTTTERIMEEYK